MPNHSQFGNRIKGFLGWMRASPTEEALSFVRTATLTSAAAATPVVLLPDSEVPAGYTPFVTGFLIRVNGTTPWATTATVKLQDTAAVDFATIAVAALTSQARVHPSSSNVTLEDAMSLATGGTAGRGLQIRGDTNGTGSPVVVTIAGVYRR